MIAKGTGWALWNLGTEFGLISNSAVDKLRVPAYHAARQYIHLAIRQVCWVKHNSLRQIMSSNLKSSAQAI